MRQIALAMMLLSAACSSGSEGPPADEPTAPTQQSGYYVGTVDGAGDPVVRGTLYIDGAIVRGTLVIEADEGYTAILHLDGSVSETGRLDAEIRDPGCEDAAVCGLEREPALYRATGTLGESSVTLDDWRFAATGEAIDEIAVVDLRLASRDGFKPVEGTLGEPGLHTYLGRVSAYFEGAGGLADGYCTLRVDLRGADEFWLDDGLIRELVCESARLGVVEDYGEFRPELRHDDERGRFAARADVGTTEVLFVGKYGSRSNDADLMGVMVADGGDYPDSAPIPDPATIPDEHVIGSFFFLRD